MHRQRTVLLLGWLISTCVLPLLPASVSGEPPSPRAPYAKVLRAKHIEARRVRAHLIYANHIEARSGCIGHILDAPERKRGKHHKHGKHGKGEKDDVGARDLRMEEVQAEVIYVDHLKADWLEADEVAGDHLNIGRCVPSSSEEPPIY